MGLIIDLIIIGIVAISVFLGYRKGLVCLAIKLFAFIIAIIVTFILYRPISNIIINSTNIDEMIQNKIIENTGDVINLNSNDGITNNLIEGAKDGMLPETSRALSINIVSGIVMIILFIGVRIGLIFVTAIANFISKLPIINQFNKIGGILYGILRGMLLIYVILLIISVAGTIKPTNSLHQNINESYIGKSMYNNNILNIFFK
ncbi:MAG: CvpA family protein [Clostridia bacterium]|nr:CvpA family protein [Clostridia bacterium]